MTDTGTRADRDCSRFREWVVWYPTGTLAADEIRRVEDHAARCPDCAALLDFSSGLRDRLVALHASHPETENLVVFAEDPDAIDDRQRAQLEEHLAACPDCAAELAMLGEIDRGETVGRSADAGRRPVLAGGQPGWLARVWEFLAGGLLRPVPAAVYAVVALAAVGLYVFRPADRSGAVLLGPDRPAGAAPSPGFVVGVELLADEADRVRQAVPLSTRITRIDPDEPQFLLLELTGLKESPAAGETFSVEILAAGSDTPRLTATAEGRLFRDDHALSLYLPAGTLAPGEYGVLVRDPAGEIVFRSSLAAESAAR
jgi:anti-sigma factor RsiW